MVQADNRCRREGGEASLANGGNSKVSVVVAVRPYALKLEFSANHESRCKLPVNADLSATEEAASVVVPVIEIRPGRRDAVGERRAQGQRRYGGAKAGTTRSCRAAASSGEHHICIVPIEDAAGVHADISACPGENRRRRRRRSPHRQVSSVSRGGHRRGSD